MKCKETRVWNVNKQMVVADTIEEAIATYREFEKDVDVESVTAICIGHYCDYVAVIKDEKGDDPVGKTDGHETLKQGGMV